MPLPKEESYAERRLLFKNIWETAREIDKVNKPKIIKTARIDTSEIMEAAKRKKQRIKNLTTVCNNILEFCKKPPDTKATIYRKITVIQRHGKDISNYKATKIKRIKRRRKTKSPKCSFTDSVIKSNKQEDLNTIALSTPNDTTTSKKPIFVQKPMTVKYISSYEGKKHRKKYRNKRKK